MKHRNTQCTAGDVIYRSTVSEISRMPHFILNIYYSDTEFLCSIKEEFLETLEFDVKFRIHSFTIKVEKRFLSVWEHVI